MIVRLLTFLILVTGVGCAIFMFPPNDYRVGYRQKGMASWYGEPFHGRRTANGEVYDMNQLSAAHRTLPFTSTIKVTNLDNQRTVVVKVNDRGPFIRGRILDLSYAAAQAIGMDQTGIAPIFLEIIQMDETPSGSYTVQAGAFRDEANALSLRRRLSGLYRDVYIDQVDRSGLPLFRVRVGKFSGIRQARNMARRLHRTQDVDTFVTRQ